MRWWSILPGGGSRAWVPVSNTDDSDETGMDDLMKMGMGHYQDEDEGSDVAQRAGLEAVGDDERPVFCRPNLRAWSSVIGMARGSASGQSQSFGSQTQACSTSNENQGAFIRAEEQSIPESQGSCGLGREESQDLDSYYAQASSKQRSCCGRLPGSTFPARRWYFVLLSVVIPLVFISLNVGLGVYSLVFYNPDQLVIDKSVKSFSIPNHRAYRNFEALMLARKDNSSRGRYRRDSSAASRNIKHLWEKRDSTQTRSRRDASLTQEINMLKHTESVLKSLGLTNILPSRKVRDSSSLTLSSNLPSISVGESLASTLGGFHRRAKRSNHKFECLLDYQSIARWKMHVIYLAQGDADLNMFTKERLKTAHDIEQRIIQHPNFHNFCLRDPHLEMYDPAVHGMNGCVPLNSLLTYFFPSVDAKGNVFYDGLGTNIDDIDSALKLAMNHETFYYYVDDKINKTFQKSHLLRSEVLFGAPLAGFSCAGSGRKDQDAKFKEFVVTYIDLLSKASTDKVQVLYGGNEIFDYEVATTFWGDVHLAMVSLVAIFVLMLVLSLSLYLTILGVVVIALSFPMSLFFYRVVFGINALGILNGAAAFVIIGIGVDDVFVFVNIYRQASHMKDPACRVKYTLRTAGVATFFTSFTTAAAFAANLASAIPAVYEFGLFMSLIVSSCWLSVFVMMPPMLYLHVCYFEPLEKMLFSCFMRTNSEAAQNTAQQGGRSQEDTGSSHNLSLQQYQRQQEAMGRGLYTDDGDVPMLDIAEDPPSDVQPFYDAMDDDDMLLIDDPYRDDPQGSRGILTIGDDWTQAGAAPSGNDNVDYINGSISTSNNNNNNNNNNMCLGRVIQRCIMFLTNRIVIRGRYFVIGFYAAVLVTSCVLMTRLQPATHPPQLFKPDTNIQQLLDLKANFSIIDTLHCDRCSGLYKVHGTHTRRNQNQVVSEPQAAASQLKPPPLPPPPPPPPPSSSPSNNSNLTTNISRPAQQQDLSLDWNPGFLGQPTPDPTNSEPEAGGGQSQGSGQGSRHQYSGSEVADNKNMGGGDGPTSALSRGIDSLTQHTDSSSLKILGTALSKLVSALGLGGGGEEAWSGHSSDSRASGQLPEPGVGPHRAEGVEDDGNNNSRDNNSNSSENNVINGDTTSDNLVVPSLVEKGLVAPPTLLPDHVFPSVQGSAGSVDENFDVCAHQACGSLKDRPLLESGATVYVVMGIIGLDRPEDDVGHVLDQFKGKALFDPKFAESFNLNDLDPDHLSELCRVCHFLANQTDLVKPGSAQCLPGGMHKLHSFLSRLPDCADLPGSRSVYHYQAPAHAEGGWDHNGRLLWLAFAFESTTSEGQAYFQAYKQYERWQGLVGHIKSEILSPGSPLTSIFQTSEFWTKVMMEVVAVHSAIYGLVLSMLICVLAVAVFTGHLVLLLLVVVTIVAMICCVVGVFTLCGWEMGAVEAVSLSILVGSSVDYLVHIVEGYILAGGRLACHVLHSQSPGELRRSRTSLAVRHIGVAVVCSALTTVIAAVPLTQTSIQPFSKFGAILLLNTSVSVVMTLTLAVALLATFAPGKYISSWRSHLVALVVAGGLTGALVLGIYIAAASFGVKVPGPSGEPLFN